MTTIHFAHKTHFCKKMIMKLIALALLLSLFYQVNAQGPKVAGYDFGKWK
jgi:hypothetical protein